MSPHGAHETWTWERLAAWAPATTLRRALDHLQLEQVDVDASAAHLAGRVADMQVGVARADGLSQCQCLAPQPCAHAAALLASASGLHAATAPAALRDAPRAAFTARDAPVPLAAFPGSAAHYDIPADTLSEAQRAALESIPGHQRASVGMYALPREDADALIGKLEAIGTTLVTFARSPYARLRATRTDGLTRLVSAEALGQTARGILERHGFRVIRRPKSLVHEWEGATAALHLAAEELARHGHAVILADAALPSFEPLAPAPPPSKPRGEPMPVILSRRRFEWWTPREGLTPLQRAVIDRHARRDSTDALLTADAVRAAERELVSAGIQTARVDLAPAVMIQADGTEEAGVASVRIPQRPLAGPIGDAMRRHGFTLAGQARGETRMSGPAANLPALALALANAGAHIVPGPDGWPTIPPPPDVPPILAQDDPRTPPARDAVLREEGEGTLTLDLSPKGAMLPRRARIELYRAGHLDDRGAIRIPRTEAGRVLALLREAGVDAKWPKPKSGDWRLTTIRYHERTRRDGGGTLVHLKGPIPLGRMGGVDPVAEQARIASIMVAMESALKAHHPDARQLAMGVLPGVWAVASGAGEFLLDAASRGAAVVPSSALVPAPVGRGVILVDTSSLPPRLMEFRRTVDEHGVLRPIVSAEFDALVRRVVTEGLEIDEVRGHYLIPSTRITAVIEALREMGAKVLQRRLAPRGKRYARWEAKLPEDETGARPRIRPRWTGEPYTGEVPGLRDESILDRHQQEGIAFILERAYCCLLADEMGLGKTLTSIAAAQFLPGRVLVVCPASARPVWRQEVRAWTTEESCVLDPGTDPNAAKEGDQKYVVVAYSGLQRFADTLSEIPFDLVILDESHYVKSRQAQRTRLVEDKLRQIPRRLILSGTPVMNEPREIRTQLAFVHPNEWSDTAWFNRRFQQPWRHGTPEVREQVLARLRDYLDGVMLRREKRQALPDLPDKHLHVHRLPLPETARRAYDEQEDAFRDYVQDHEEDAFTSGLSATSGQLEALKQTALIGKLPSIIADIRTLLGTELEIPAATKGKKAKAAEQEKIVIFCHYREPIRALAKELASYGVVTLTGSTKPDDRGRVVEQFQKDPDIRVFVGQTVAAGTAITLTRARHAVFTDLEWNPALHRQAMDRIHRKTQTRAVEIHFYLAEDTIEEDIAEVLEEKTQMMDQLLEGRKGGTMGLRETDAVQREVALRILSRRRRLMATDDDD